MKVGGRRFSRPRNKLGELVQLDEVTVNWKLAGSRSNRIITVLIYKPSKVIQLWYFVMCQDKDDIITLYPVSYPLCQAFQLIEKNSTISSAFD